MMVVLGLIARKVMGGWIKYALLAAVIAGGFFYIRNMGVQSERAKWERASRIEQVRQAKVNEEAVQLSTRLADIIVEQVFELDDRHEAARKGAENETDIDSIGLSANGIMRLNSIR